MAFGLRLAAAAVVAVLLAACTAGDENRPTSSSSSTSTGPSPGDGGALDAVASEEALDPTGEYMQIRTMTLDADGEPIVLYASLENEPLLIARRRGEEWTPIRLSDPPVEEFDANASAAVDGTLVVTGYVDSRFSLVRVAPDGPVTAVPLATDLGSGDPGSAIPAVTADGATAYVGVFDREAESRLLAVDVATGAVRSEYRFPSEADGLVAARSIRIAGDQVLVVFHRGIGTGEDGSEQPVTPWLGRFDLDLQPLGEVQLGETGASAGFDAVAVDDRGTVYVALRVGEYQTPGVEVRLVEVAPDATAPTTLATFPGDDLIDGLAVDPAGAWAYIAGLDDGDEEFTATVTAVDLTGTDEPETSSLCGSTHVDGMGVTPDGGALLVATNCQDRDVHSTLFTLR